MNNMARKLVAAVLCFALLSACAPIAINVEDLLAPPRLNELQTQVQQALEAHTTLGVDQYRYPREGAYRSPFVLRDMNGDGLYEAIVFYTPENSVGIRLKVLREQPDGSWKLTDDRAGFGNQVHIVKFANLLSPDSLCLVVGWEDSATGERRLDVFSHQNGRLHALYHNNYTVFNIAQYKAGDLEQIALVRQDMAGAFHLHLLGKTPDGRLSVMGDAALSEDIYEVINLTKGVMREEINGIFVDSRRFSGDRPIATEVFEVSNVGGEPAWLHPLVADIDIETINRLYRQTFRFDGSLLSVDLRSDGNVVIPVHHEEPLPGFFAEPEAEPPPLVLFKSYDYAGLLEVADMAVINADAGYLFFFPTRWVGNVTVLRPEMNEWQFWAVDMLTNRPAVELLRIRVYFIHDHQDRFTEDYVRLADRGLFQYYGYLPNRIGELALTQQEMENNFMLL